MSLEKFDNWNKIKKQIHSFEGKLPFVKEGSIYFVKFGENIGFEQNGKGEEFHRPILVIKKIGNLFFCLPLTKSEKENPFYYTLKTTNFGFTSKLILSQGKVLDKKRFFQFTGKILEEEFLEIKKLLKEIYL